MVTSAIKLRHLLLGIKAMTYLDSILKSRNITLLTNLSSQSYGYSSSHVRMWELDHKVGCMPKNWCFRTVVLVKTLENPLDSKINLVNPKGNQPRIFIGRTDAEAEAPILGPPDSKRTHWKRPWCWERLREGREGDNRRWDGWMASSAQWTGAWANSGRQWRTGNPGVLQSMRWQKVRHDLVTEQ